MHDKQSERDHRELAIDKVGVRGLRFPIQIRDKARSTQNTVATIGMYVDLPKEFKGTHMSRFIEALNEHRGEVTFRTLPQLVADLRQRLSAPSATVEVQFPYFVEQFAPVTKEPGPMDCACWSRATGSDTSVSFTLVV